MLVVLTTSIVRKSHALVQMIEIQDQITVEVHNTQMVPSEAAPLNAYFKEEDKNQQF